MRRRRVLAMLVAALVSVALLGGCGDSGPKAEDLAAQDRLVTAANRLAAIRTAAVEQRLARERHAYSLAAMEAPPTTEPPTPAVLRLLGITIDDLCAPIAHTGGRTQRREQRMLERRRKQALYYLNLSCPPSPTR